MNKHPGFLALHVAVDDKRMAFTQMLPDQKAETTIGFLDQAVGFFARHGIGVRALLTDNGSNYRSQLFRQAWQRMDIKHRRTRPYTPRTNGKAERFIQTALREWAYAKHWNSSQERDLHLQPWNDCYNRERPHGSLDYKPPISRSDYGTTSRPSTGTLGLSAEHGCSSRLRSTYSKRDSDIEVRAAKVPNQKKRPG